MNFFFFFFFKSFQIYKAINIFYINCYYYTLQIEETAGSNSEFLKLKILVEKRQTIGRSKNLNSNIDFEYNKNNRSINFDQDTEKSGSVVGNDRCSYISNSNYKIGDTCLVLKKEKKRLKKNKLKIMSRGNFEAILKEKSLSLKGLSKTGSVVFNDNCQNDSLKNFESWGKKVKFDENCLGIKIEKSNDSKKICWREPVEESFIIVPCRSSNDDTSCNKENIEGIIAKDQFRNELENEKSIKCNFRMIAGSDFGIGEDNQIRGFDIFDKNWNDRSRNEKGSVEKINEETCIDKNLNEEVIKICSALINERDKDNENLIDSKMRDDDKYKSNYINDKESQTDNFNIKNDRESSIYKIIEEYSKISEKYLNIDNNENKLNFLGKELSIISSLNFRDLIGSIGRNGNSVKVLKNILLNETFDENILNDKLVENFVDKIIDSVKISLDESGYAINERGDDDFNEKKIFITSEQIDDQQFMVMDDRTTWKMELKKIVSDIMKRNLKRNIDGKNYSLTLKIKTMILPAGIKTNQEIEKEIVKKNLDNDDLKSESNNGSIESKMRNVARINCRRKKIKGSIFLNKNNVINDLKKCLYSKKFSSNLIKDLLRVFLSGKIFKLKEDKLLTVKIMKDKEIEKSRYFLNKSLSKDSKRFLKDSFSQTITASDWKDFDISISKNLNNRDKSVQTIIQLSLNDIEKSEEKEKANKSEGSKSCQTESFEKFLEKLIKCEKKFRRINSTSFEYMNDDSVSKKLLDVIKKIRNNMQLMNDNLISSKEIYAEGISDEEIRLKKIEIKDESLLNLDSEKNSRQSFSLNLRIKNDKDEVKVLSNGNKNSERNDHDRAIFPNESMEDIDKVESINDVEINQAILGSVKDEFYSEERNSSELKKFSYSNNYINNNIVSEKINFKEKEEELENSDENNVRIEKIKNYSDILMRRYSNDEEDKIFGVTDNPSEFRKYNYDKNYLCCKESTEIEIEKFVDTVASLMRTLSRSIKIDTIKLIV